MAAGGGEEFIAIIVNVESKKLGAIAERYRLLVEQSQLVRDPVNIAVTISIGATLSRPDDTVESIIKRADKLMYHSKALGRNRVTCDSEHPSSEPA